MTEQLQLLQQTDWRVLIVLDACRADFFQEVHADAETVRSPACYTATWIRALIGKGVLDGAVYLTANPMVSRILKECATNGHVPVRRDLWDEHWSGYQDVLYPTVLPGDVTQAVKNHIQWQGMPDRLVVHYLQPHAPYIGKNKLRLHVSIAPRHNVRLGLKTDWPRGKELTILLRAGKIKAKRIRKAYRGNLALALEAVEDLLPSLEGKVIITSDHGELLGEDGFVGHPVGTEYELLRSVPWWERTGGGLVPTYESFPAGRASGTMEDKLKALGYV